MTIIRMALSAFLTILVTWMAATNTVGQAYHLEEHLDQTQNRSIALLRYFNRWTAFRHLDPFEDILSGLLPHTFHSLPEGVPKDSGVGKPDSTPRGGGDKYDLSYLSFIDKEHLKGAGSIEEVRKITGLSLLTKEEEEEAATVVVPFSSAPKRTMAYTVMRRRLRPKGHDKRNENAIQFAKRAVCEPEKVSVPLFAEEGFRPIPACVRVKKCGGCCRPGLVCVATKTNKLKIQVINLPLNGEFLENKITEEMREDEACECQCDLKERNCLPTQYYDSANCSCYCKPELEVVSRECEASHGHWDTYRCTCICPLSGPQSDSDCGSGEKFNSSACHCEKE